MQFNQRYAMVPKFVWFMFFLILESSCNNIGNSPNSVNSSSNVQSQNSLNMLYASSLSNNKQPTSLRLGSTIGNQQSFKVLQVTGNVTVESSTITFFFDNACESVDKISSFIGPITYSSESGTLYTSDQSLYYSCQTAFKAGCTRESQVINSIQFSYTMTNGQTTTMACMTNEKMANYTTSPVSACTSGSPCGFSVPYPTYTLFPAFAWISGESTLNNLGIYGTLGIPNESNIPGARFQAISWIDNANNLWLFGGTGYAVNGVANSLNDLWEYNTSTKLWTWVSGANIVNQPGVYGTQRNPSESNIPGARNRSVSWIDSSDNLWLFGGNGNATSIKNGSLNDLWEYNTSSGMWVWISGANTINQSGVYGTQGVPAVNNIPGARAASISWIDSSDNLWLFGGSGYAESTISGKLNDLWEYNTSSGMWVWISGSESLNQNGIYGTQGAPAASNAPGARYRARNWIDSSGNLWLFGGVGYAANTIESGELNDLWQYNPNTNMWTWVSGESTLFNSNAYGNLGVASSTNIIGARDFFITWIDSSDNLWLFGGESNSNNSAPNYYNDLWKINLGN